MTAFADSAGPGGNYARMFDEPIGSTCAWLFKEETKTPTVTWNRAAAVIEELNEIFSECSVDDWDDYGAAALKNKAYQEIKSFIESMPASMELPEIVAEPTGDIGLQWSFGLNKILTVSFSGNNTATYAAILGSSEHTRYGKEPFLGSVPRFIAKMENQLRG